MSGVSPPSDFLDQLGAVGQESVATFHPAFQSECRHLAGEGARSFDRISRYLEILLLAGFRANINCMFYLL